MSLADPDDAIRVVVAAGTRLACDAYSARLGAEEDMMVIAAPGPLAALAELVPRLAPQVIVVDPHAGGADADAVSELNNLRGAPAIVALVAERDRALALQFVRSGIAATVLKTAPADELVAAVRWVAQGASWISPPILRYIVDALHGLPAVADERLHRLTPREREVLQLMVDGLTRRQVASELYLAVDTVRTHTRTVMEKLGVHSGAAAVSVALSAGLRPSA